MIKNLITQMTSKDSIPSILLSLYAIFYMTHLLFIVNLKIFPTINRITHYDATINWSFLNPNLDAVMVLALFSAYALFRFDKYFSFSILTGVSISMILFFMDPTHIVANITPLLTLPLLIILFMTSKFNKRIQMSSIQIYNNKYHLDLQKSLKVFFQVLTIFEFVVFLRWIVYPFLHGTSDWIWRFNDLETNLFYAFGLLAPYLILLIIFSFLIKLSIPNIVNLKLSKLLQKSDTIKNESELIYSNTIKKVSLYFHNDQKILLVILLISGFSIFLTLYPFIISNNPDLKTLGTDTPLYLKWLIKIQSISGNTSYVLSQVFTDNSLGTNPLASRPLSLISMQAISALTGQKADVVLKYLSSFLGPILVVSVYFLMRSAYPDRKELAVLSSILTAVSHQIVIGFYAAYYANWMALIAMFFAISFLLKILNEKPNRKNFFLYAVLTTAALFYHSFTWSYFVAVVVLFLIWTIVIKRRLKQSIRTIIILSIITASIIAIDIIRTSGGTSNIFETELNPDITVGLGQYAARWNNLDTTFRIYLGGYLTNSAILVLLFVWTLKANYQNNSDRFFLSMFFVSILPVLFGDYVVQSRIFYNIPMQIPASIMLYKIYTNPKIRFGKFLVYATILMQFNYALRAMANMELVPLT